MDLDRIVISIEAEGQKARAEADSTAQHIESRMGKVSGNVQSVLSRAFSVGLGASKFVLGPINAIHDALASIPKTAASVGGSMESSMASFGVMLSDAALAQAGYFQTAEEKAQKAADALAKTTAKKVGDIKEKIAEMEEDHAEKVADIRSKMEEASGKDITERRNALLEALTELEEKHAASLEKLTESRLEADEKYTEQIQSATENRNEKLADLEKKHASVLADIAADVDEENQSYAEKVVDRAEAYQEKITALAEKHTEARKKIESQIGEETERYLEKVASITERIQERITDLQERHAETRKKLEADVAEEMERYQERLADVTATFQERLTDLAERHAERRADLLEQLEEKIADFKEKMEERKYDYEEDRAEASEKLVDKKASYETKKAQITAAYQEKLAKATSQAEKDRLKAAYDAQMKAVNDAIAATEKAHADDEAKAKARYDRENEALKKAHERQVAQLQERIAKEDAEYARQQTKLEQERDKTLATEKRAHDRKLADLQAALAKEDAEYTRQRTKLEQERDKSLASEKKAHERKLTELQTALAKEDAEYAKAKATEDKRYADDLAKLAQAHQKKLDSLAERLLKENEKYAEQTTEVEENYQKQLTKIEEVHNKALEALDKRIALENAAYDKQRLKLEADAAKDIEKLEAQGAKRYAELEKQLERENKLYLRKKEDLETSLEEAAKGKKGAARTPVTEMGSMIENLTKYGMERGLIQDASELEPDKNSSPEEAAAKARKRAEVTIAWVRQQAKDTPYGVQDLISMTNRLTSYQLDATKWFTTLGNVASGMHKPLSQVVDAIGTLATGDTGEAILRFRELGISLQTMEGLEFNAQGSLITPIDEALDIIKRNVDVRFGGMMQEQSKTMSGVMSTLQDTWAENIGAITAPAFGFIRDQLFNLLSWLNSPEGAKALDDLTTSLTNLVQQGVDKLKEAIQWVMDHREDIELTFNAIKSVIEELIKFIVDNGDDWWNAFKGFFQFVIDHKDTVTQGLVAILTAIMAYKTAMTIIGVINGLATAFNLLKVAMVGPGWTGAAGGAGAGPGGLIGMLGKLKTWITGLPAMVGGLATAFAALGPAGWIIAGVLAILVALFAWWQIDGKGLEEAWVNLSTNVKKSWDNLGDAMGQAGKAIGDALGDAGKRIGDNWEKQWDQAGKDFKEFSDGLGKAGKDIGDTMGKIGKETGDTFGAFGKHIGDAMGDAGEAIGGFIDEVGKVPSRLGGLKDDIGSKMGEIGKKIGDTMGQAGKDIGDTFDKAKKDTATALVGTDGQGGLWGNVRNAFDNTRSKVNEVLFGSATESGNGGLKGNVVNAWNSITSGVNDALKGKGGEGGGLVNNVLKAWNDISDDTDSWLNGGGTGSNTLGMIAGIYKGWASIATGIFNTLFGGGEGKGKGITGDIQDGWDKARKTTNMWLWGNENGQGTERGGLTGAIWSAWDRMLSDITNFLKNIWDEIGRVWDGIGKTINNVLWGNDQGTYSQGKGGGIVGTIWDAWNNITDIIHDFLVGDDDKGGIKNQIESTWNGFVTFITGLVPDISKAVKDFIDGIGNAINERWPWVSELIDKMRSALEGIGKAIRDALDALGRATGRGGGGFAPGEDSTAPDGAGYHFPVKGYSGGVATHWDGNVGSADLFAAKGTSVVAMTSGRVTYAGSDPIGGNNLVIRGDDGRDYYYAHLFQPPSVTTGQSVYAGQYVGGVGDTGNAKGTGDHLHIGIGYGISTGTRMGGGGLNFNARDFLKNVLGGSQNKLFTGGLIDEPIMGWGLKSGESYSLGERGIETVIPGDMGNLLQKVAAALTTGSFAPSRNLTGVLIRAIRHAEGAAVKQYNLTYIGREYGQQSIRQTLRALELEASLTE